MKIRPIGSELYYADRVTDGERERDRQTDRHDKANSRSSQFCGLVINDLFPHLLHTKQDCSPY